MLLEVATLLLDVLTLDVDDCSMAVSNEALLSSRVSVHSIRVASRFESLSREVSRPMQVWRGWSRFAVRVLSEFSISVPKSTKVEGRAAGC